MTVKIELTEQDLQQAIGLLLARIRKLEARRDGLDTELSKALATNRAKLLEVHAAVDRIMAKLELAAVTDDPPSYELLSDKLELIRRKLYSTEVQPGQPRLRDIL